MTFPTVSKRLIPFSFCACLAACGGGGGGSSQTPVTGDQFQPGVFEASSAFFNQCASPVPGGTNTDTGAAYGSGSTRVENNWLRSWSNELYLWYDEIQDQNPANFSTEEYFELMKTEALTASGNPRDQFHFSIPTPEWLDSSQSGVVAGYGAQFALLSTTPPREAAIAYVEPGTPAAAAGLTRGARIISVDGVDLVNSNDTDTLNGGLFPTAGGETHTFEVRDLGASTTRSVMLTSAEITTTPVQNVSVITTGTGPVGYLTFNDHIRPAENQLIAAIEQLATANVTDLIIDVRYNGGGFLYIASQLAYMIAGNTSTNGRAFETLTFNDKHPDTDPVTGEALEPIPFYNTSTDNAPLPSLNLPRVFVLTGSSTCSASESIINGLEGVGVQVIQIGGTTCGKPYGFYPTDNCATTYFSIQFRGENNAGFGDYPDGFSPQNATQAGSVSLPGCAVGDDFNSALGDITEARLAAALEYRSSGSCPTSSVVSDGSSPQRASATLTGPMNVKTPKPAWLENRLM